jgi:UrcA family protein
MKVQSTLLALLVAGSFAVITPAAPVEDPDSVQIRSERVRYDAANIQDEDAARKLFFRIRRAAEEVCSIASNPRGYEIWHEHACEADAVAGAVRDAEVPALDDYYSGLTGQEVHMER